MSNQNQTAPATSPVSVLFWSTANQGSTTTVTCQAQLNGDGEYELKVGTVLDKLAEAGIDAESYGLTCFENNFKLDTTTGGRTAVLPVNFEDGVAQGTIKPVAGVTEDYSIAILAAPRKTSAGGAREVLQAAIENAVEAGLQLSESDNSYLAGIVARIPAPEVSATTAFSQAISTYVPPTEGPEVDEEIQGLRDLMRR